jgi:tetratricopeptide (TPR) repeat protein
VASRGPVIRLDPHVLVWHGCHRRGSAGVREGQSVTSLPASWHADPLGWHQLRYWDGGQWTDHVADSGVQSVDSIKRGQKPATAPATVEPRGPRLAPVWGPPEKVAPGSPAGGSTPTATSENQLTPVSSPAAPATDGDGDLRSAMAAYGAADAGGDAEAAVLLGQALRRAGKVDLARAAFERSEARGHREAAGCLGNMLVDLGDAEGARAAYERGVAAGSAISLLNLGLMLCDLGEADDALRYLQMARRNGDPEAHWAVGTLLEDKGDRVGAADAYRAGAEAGFPPAVYRLGWVLLDLDDRAGARAAFQRADELGHEGAKDALAAMKREEGPSAQNDELAHQLAHRLAAACKQAMKQHESCLESLDWVHKARNAAAQPQHPISRETFETEARRYEREFLANLQAFTATQEAARELRSQFLFVVGAPDQGMDKLLFPLLTDGVIKADEISDIMIGGIVAKPSFGSTIAEFIATNDSMQQMLGSLGK